MYVVYFLLQYCSDKACKLRYIVHIGRYLSRKSNFRQDVLKFDFLTFNLDYRLVAYHNHFLSKVVLLQIVVPLLDFLVGALKFFQKKKKIENQFFSKQTNKQTKNLFKRFKKNFTWVRRWIIWISRNWLISRLLLRVSS